MTQKRVQLFGQNRGVEIDIDATPGAVVGVNLLNQDGTLYTPPGAGVPDDEFPITFWRLIQEIPPNVVALAETETTGIYVVTGVGSSATRSMDDSSTIEWVNGSGVAGNPSPSLKELPDTGIGAALVKLTRDAYGRVEGTEAATTDDLPEGAANLYFTDARADARITLQKGAANGLATLDGDAKLQANQLPALAITDTFVVADEAAMLALDAQQGDVAVRTDEEKSYILTADPASVLANWQELLTPTGTGGTVTAVDVAVPTGFTSSGGPVTSSGTITVAYDTGYQGYTAAEASKLAGIETGAEVNAVDSVNGQTGAVSLDAGDVGAATTAQGALADSAVQPGDNVSVLVNDAAYVDAAGAQSAVVAASIVDGDTTHAPSGDAVFDALATKADDSNVVHKTGAETIAGLKTFTDNLTVATGPSSGRVAVSSITGQISDFALQSNGLDRWVHRCQNDVESGSNAGSTYSLRSRDDTGVQLNTIYTVDRPTGVLDFPQVAPTIFGNTIWHTGNLTPYSDSAARAAVISASITDGDTTHAPSGDAVFDALALKAPKSEGALVSLSVAGSIASGATEAVSFDVETYDDSAYHSGANPTRLTVPVAGRYVLSFVLGFQGNASGVRLAFVSKNGAAFIGRPVQRILPNGAGADYMTATSAPIACAAGDYFELMANQTSGVSLAISGGGAGTWFSIMRVD